MCLPSVTTLTAGREGGWGGSEREKGREGGGGGKRMKGGGREGGVRQVNI